MKEKTKRFAALTAAVIALAVFSASAAAITPADDREKFPSAEPLSGTIESGRSYSTVLERNDSQAVYKLVVGGTGTLKVEFTAKMRTFHPYLYDQNRNLVDYGRRTITAGADYIGYWRSIDWDGTKSTGTLNFSVSKGTYYLRFIRDYNDGNGTFTFKATFPQGTGTTSSGGNSGRSTNGDMQAKSSRTYNGHKYSLYESGCTWNEAKQYCEQLGGHLATITSAGEEEIVEAMVKQGAKNSYWLGGYRTGSDSFAWVTGEAFSYTHWLGWQPDNYQGLEDRVAMSNKILQFGGWNDVRADGECNGEKEFGAHNFGFICEWDNGTSSGGSSSSGKTSGAGSSTAGGNALVCAMEPGESVLFRVAGGRDATWTSSNPSVAKVSRKGRVTALNEGTAVITATAGSSKLSITIEVEE